MWWPSVESSRKSYPCSIEDCKYVGVSDRALASHLRKVHRHGVNFFWKCPPGGPNCDTTKLWLVKDSFKEHLLRVHGISPDNNYISSCIDSSDRHPTPPLLADPEPVKKPPVKKPPVKKSPPKKPPLKRLLPKEVQPQEKPLQEEPAQEHVHQGLPAGRQELQESVQDRMFNTPQAGPSPDPPPCEPLREESSQQFCHRMQAERAARDMSIPASAPLTAEVTRLRESQWALLKDEEWEAFLEQEFSNDESLAPSLPEELHTGLPQKVLFGEKQVEGAQSHQQPPREPPARWGTIPESSTASTRTSSTADGQYVAARNQTEDDQTSPDSAGSSI